MVDSVVIFIVLWGVIVGGGILVLGYGMIRNHRDEVRRHHERMAEMRKQQK